MNRLTYIKRRDLYYKLSTGKTVPPWWNCG